MIDHAELAWFFWASLKFTLLVCWTGFIFDLGVRHGRRAAMKHAAESFHAFLKREKHQANYSNMIPTDYNAKGKV